MDDPPLFPDLLTSLLEVPDDQIDDPNENLDHDYKEWGLNIYRTAYGSPDLDRAWEALVEDVRTHVRLQIQGRYTNENEEEVEAAKKLMSLFRLSVHSDAETLQGADLDQLRQVHAEDVRTGKALSNACWALRQMFFVADGEVLTDVATGDFWIKCVEADYMASRHVGRDRSRVPQQYFGWFKMRSNRFIELWLELQFHHLDSIAPPTIGGMHLEICDTYAEKYIHIYKTTSRIGMLKPHRTNTSFFDRVYARLATEDFWPLRADQVVMADNGREPDL